MGNNNNRVKKLYCCYHKKTPERNYECANFIPYINPCCIHENSQGLGCNFKLIVLGNLILNSLLILSLICYIIQNLADSTLLFILISVLLIWAGFSRNFNFKKQQIQRLIIGVVVIIIIRIVSKIILFLVPNFLLSYWSMLLGLLMFLYLYSIQKQKILVKSQLTNIKSLKIIRSQICCICLDKKCTIVVFPCLHGSYCDNCIGSLNKCALCRTNIHHIDALQNFKN